jgi:hypothetical protein
LSRQAADELLASTGDLLTGFGFTQDAALEYADAAAQLAADLGSFQNLETADVLDRINKAATGEVESLKALGVVIRQDTQEYKDLVASIQLAEGATLTQAKALANLQIITEQSQNAIGDFERSQDSFANTQRTTQAALEDLKATLGEGLLPIATNLVSAFGSLVRGLDNLISKSREAKQELLDTRLEAAGLTDTVVDSTKELNQLEGILGRVFNVGATVQELEQGIRAIAAATGLTTEQVVSAAKAELELSEAQLERIEAAEKLIETSTRAFTVQELLAISNQNYLELLEGIQAALVEVNDELGDGETITKRFEKAQRDLLSKTTESYEELPQLWSDTIDEFKSGFVDEYIAGLEKMAEQEEKFAKQRENAAISLYSALGDLIVANIEDEQAAFRAKQAFAIGEAIINTSRAVTEVLPNIPAAVLIGLAGAAEVATIASQPVPSAQFGGAFTVPPGNRGDGAIMKVNSGEDVSVSQSRFSGGRGNGDVIIQINQREFARISIDAINSGQGGRLEGRIINA